MPAVNGVASPTPLASDNTPSLSAKRKRSESATAPHVNGTDVSLKQHVQQDHGITTTLKDILTVLERHDTTPSILSITLPQSSSDSLASEPTTKRAKLSEQPSSTVLDKLQKSSYTTLRQLEEDVELAASEILKPLIAKEAAVPVGAYGSRSTLTIDDTRLWTGVLAFQKILKSIVERETSQAQVKKELVDKTGIKSGDNKALANGTDHKVKQEDDGDVFEDGAKVLTIFANASGQKQLFSSFQKTTRIDDAQSLAPRKNLHTVDVLMPLRESGLPNIISASTIPNFPTDDSVKAKEKRPTIGELFPPHRRLPQLEPPEPAKFKGTKDSTLGSATPNAKKQPRRSSYNWTECKLNVGHWLGWGGLDSSHEFSSPEAKRKLRDRALSTGESRPSTSKGEQKAHEQAKDEALFRKVYSSFAPTHDNTAATVPQNQRNELWWSKMGRSRAQRNMLIDPDLLDYGSGVADDEAVEEDEDAAFAEAVESFEPMPLTAEESDLLEREKDTESLLQDVSDLIETIYSYQLIRNKTISKPATREAQQIVKASVGTPSTPSDAEHEVYKMLRNQLVILVSSLPPYALARLNGDRLKDLSISTNILIETSNDRGVMEEDQATRLAKQTALTSATGAQTAARPAATSTYSNYATAGQYSRASTTQTAAARPPPTNYGTPQSYQSQQGTAAARGTPINYHRTTSGVQTYVGSYPTTTPRPGQTPQQQYQSAARPSTYSQTSSQYLAQMQASAQAASASKYNYSQYYSGAAGTPSNRPAYPSSAAAAAAAAAASQQPPSSSSSAAAAAIGTPGSASQGSYIPRPPSSAHTPSASASATATPSHPHSPFAAPRTASPANNNTATPQGGPLPPSQPRTNYAVQGGQARSLYAPAPAAGAAGAGAAPAAPIGQAYGAAGGASASVGGQR